MLEDGFTLVKSKRMKFKRKLDVEMTEIDEAPHSQNDTAAIPQKKKKQRMLEMVDETVSSSLTRWVNFINFMLFFCQKCHFST